MTAGRNAAAPVPCRTHGTLLPSLSAVFSGHPVHTGPRPHLRIFWMMLRFRGIFAALRKSHRKVPKCGEMTGPGLAVCICRGLRVCMMNEEKCHCRGRANGDI